MDEVNLERCGAVALVTIQRPTALNALNRAVLEQLSRTLDELDGDPSVRVVVVAGAGGKAFVAGADIAEMSGMNAAEAEAFSRFGQDVFDKLSRLRCPTIAAVGGFALGGGCELAMATDILIVGPKAKFGQPEVKLGVIPGFGGTQRLVRRVGPAVALDLCLTGRLVDGAEALRIGIASRLVEGDVVEAAMGVAAEISAMAPLAVGWCKRAIHEGADLGLDGACKAERSLFALCFSTADQKEGMSAFLAKRAPAFEGR